MTESIDRIIAALESRIGRVATGLVIGLSLLVLAAICVRPAVHTTALGNVYAQMASDPFSSSGKNALGYRVLTPAISWLLHLRGQRIIFTNLIFAVLFLAAIYLYFREKTLSSREALFGAAVMAFTLPTLFTLYDGGYTDATTYLLILLMWWFRKRRVVFYVLFLLALLNRESVVFLAPWFILVRWQDTRKLGKWLPDTVIGYACALGVYYLFRHFISTAVRVDFNTAYYLKPLVDDPWYWLRRSYPFQALGLFTVFQLLWIFPVMAVVHMWQAGKRARVLSLAVLLACVSAQLVVAFDSSRMLTMGFPVMIISLVYLFRTGAFEFRRWALPVLILNFLMPQLYTASHIVEIWYSTPANIIKVALFGQKW